MPKPAYAAPPRLDFKPLRAAVAVRETGTVTAAARRLGITQPALSRMIAALEAELGFALFTRDGRRLQPAPGAIWFLDQAAVTLTSAARLGDLAVAVRGGRILRLRIAAPTNLAQDVLPQALVGFARCWPDVDVEVLIRRRPEMLRALAGCEIDFALGVLPVGESHVKVRPFATTEAICMLPASHRLAHAVEVTPAMLAGETHIGLPEGSVLRHWVEDAFAAAGARYRCGFTVDSNLIAARLVAAGLGCSVIHPLAAGGLPPGVVQRPFRPALPLTYALLQRSDAGLDAVGNPLEAMLRQAAESGYVVSA